MSNEKEDGRLEAAFEALRQDTTARAPDVHRMLDVARSDAEGAPRLAVVDGGAAHDGPGTDGMRHGSASRQRLVRFGGWVSLAAAAGAAGLLFVESGVDPEDAEFEALVAAYSTDAASGAWRSPTAALLDVPGLDLGAVPSVGGVLPAGSDGRAAAGRDS